MPLTGSYHRRVVQPAKGAHGRLLARFEHTDITMLHVTDMGLEVTRQQPVATAVRQGVATRGRHSGTSAVVSLPMQLPLSTSHTAMPRSGFLLLPMQEFQH